MLPDFNKVKGVHPGAILKRELKIRNLKSIELAKSIDEHPQTINAITKERRGVNPKLSIKLGEYFEVTTDYFMLLQASYEVSRMIEKDFGNPLLGKLRSALFWDTEISKIDSQKHKRAIIQRVLERGNRKEIKELINFYGLEMIKKEVGQIEKSFIPNYEKNVLEYINN